MNDPTHQEPWRWASEILILGRSAVLKCESEYRAAYPGVQITIRPCRVPFLYRFNFTRIDREVREP